jgi:hypothetical protein
LILAKRRVLHVQLENINLIQDKHYVSHAFQVHTAMRQEESSASFVVPTLLLMSLVNIRVKNVFQAKSQ